MLRRALASRQTLLRHRVLSTRTETDSFGPLRSAIRQVLWGPNRKVHDQLPHRRARGAHATLALIHAFGVLKKCSALYNKRTGRLDEKIADAIAAAADEVAKVNSTTTSRSWSIRLAVARRRT